MLSKANKPIDFARSIGMNPKGGLTMLSRLRTYLMFALFLLLSFTQIINAQTPPSQGNIIITEFRTRGPNGQNDEFIEVYNNTDSNIVVVDSHPITCAAQVLLNGPSIQCGWAIVDPIGGTSSIPRAVIPTGDNIPARGHYLLTNSGDTNNPGYSLTSYAAANRTYTPPAYGDSDFTGLALYRTADRTQFNNTELLDAVGFDGIASPYKEGTGLQVTFSESDTENGNNNFEQSFVRKTDLTTSRPVDTNNNLNDFVFVATTAGGSGASATAILGAPGPENTTSPIESTSKFTFAAFDPSRSTSQSPNRCYDATDTSPGAGAKGSLFIRRNITNNSAPTTQQRFRIVDITTVGSPGSTNTSQAIIKAVSSSGGTAVCPNNLSNGTPVAVQDTTLESPSSASGGGLNSSLSTTPIPAGQNRNVLYRLAADRTGTFRFLVIVEAK